ncbi:hypothetical protein LOK49_LG14G00904 [Camellia lanceoleosa]|uniref:Uncharacterized protein n=1 Tax=Camellia lanceoleosa TaxID=1840588 RepID=A0ACC0FCH1_9ERIC|nr:hypothetical protein LOK49_LG14G00904 [Camellia lanceoleosa]
MRDMVDGRDGEGEGERRMVEGRDGEEQRMAEGGDYHCKGRRMAEGGDCHGEGRSMAEGGDCHGEGRSMEKGLQATARRDCGPEEGNNAPQSMPPHSMPLVYPTQTSFQELLQDERDDLSRVDLDKFNSIINEVESLHQLVQNPLKVGPIQTQNSGNKHAGVNPWCGGVDPLGRNDNAGSRQGVDPWTRRVDTKFQQLNPDSTIYKGPPFPDWEIDNNKNMATTFKILGKNKRDRLENLVLNKNSIAQTVENVFALSFLVKDGQVEITVNGKAPRNAPAANEVVLGKVSYGHFGLRRDFIYWKVFER